MRGLNLRALFAATSLPLLGGGCGAGSGVPVSKPAYLSLSQTIEAGATFESCVNSWRKSAARERVHRQLAARPDADYLLLEEGSPSPPHYYGYTLLIDGKLIVGLGSGRASERAPDVELAGWFSEAQARGLPRMTSGIDLLAMDGGCYMVRYRFAGQEGECGVYAVSAVKSRAAGEDERRVLILLDRYKEASRVE